MILSEKLNYLMYSLLSLRLISQYVSTLKSTVSHGRWGPPSPTAEYVG